MPRTATASLSAVAFSGLRMENNAGGWQLTSMFPCNASLQKLSWENRMNHSGSQMRVRCVLRRCLQYARWQWSQPRGHAFFQAAAHLDDPQLLRPCEGRFVPVNSTFQKLRQHKPSSMISKNFKLKNVWRIQTNYQKTTCQATTVQRKNKRHKNNLNHPIGAMVMPKIMPGEGFWPAPECYVV